ncbi:unnamed protein product [Euphydryas editha]|uniref:Uncharacterized protein n=1 Tax=Euphydryas editha TaxID=104508 RepID=A0AAU9TGC7_EUPED|nr:unnamed protein product [Euphydryas editha]
MAYIFMSIAILYLLTPISTKQVYYPEFAWPNAIVFDGPTNYEDRGSDQFIEDFDLDIRFNRPMKSNENNCPNGYHLQGDVCFPDD